MIINITRKEPDQIGWRAFMIQTPIIIANTGLFELQITVPFEANWTVRHYDLGNRSTNKKFI